MRRLAVNALALVLMPATIGMGQQPGARPPGFPGPAGGSPAQKEKTKKPPDKSKLEEMLAQALKTNPDIRVAVANVALAEAELNRTRLQVTQKIVALYHAIDAQKMSVKYQEHKYNSMEKLHKTGDVPMGDLEESRRQLALTKAKLTELEAQMPALLGKITKANSRDGYNWIPLQFTQIWSDDGLQALMQSGVISTIKLRESVEKSKAQGPLAERMRKALQTHVKVDYKDVKFSEAIKELEKKAPGLSFHIRDTPVAGKPHSYEATMTLHFDTPLPITAILQAIADEAGCHFIVRDYGILVTAREPPRGAVTVQEFIRQKPSDTPTRPPSGRK